MLRSFGCFVYFDLFGRGAIVKCQIRVFVCVCFDKIHQNSNSKFGLNFRNTDDVLLFQGK